MLQGVSPQRVKGTTLQAIAGNILKQDKRRSSLHNQKSFEQWKIESLALV